MKKLNLPDYKAALKIIPEILGVAFNTFHNYRRLCVGDKADIPYEMVNKLEKLFKLKTGHLINFSIEYNPYRFILIRKGLVTRSQVDDT